MFGLWVACSLAACGGPDSEPGPRWIDLSHGFRPSVRRLEGRSAWTLPASGRQPIRITPDRHGRPSFRYTAAIERGDWTHVAADVWRAERPLPQDWKRATDDPSAEMRIGGEPVTLCDLRGLGNTLDSKVPGVPFEPAMAEALDGIVKPAYCLSAASIYLFTEDDEPADRISFAEQVDLGTDENGAWCLAVAGIYGHGIPVLSGGSEEVEVDVPPDSALRFSTTCEPVPEGSGTAGAEITFRVRLDGETLLTSTRPVGSRVRTVHHTIPLAEAGLAGATLAFDVSGPARIGAFLHPTIGPAEVGTYGDRPWEGDRPDVILFLADTFRADNLAVYGGDPALTPALNELAEEGVVFLNARAPSSWTYPSHAAMFSGLYPHQAGTVTRRSALPAAAWTIGEELRAVGYRTAAVTESAYASQTFGLAQGFDRFEEHRESYETTLARARVLIEADDGRPLFLFVHTYRAHHPYRVDEPTRERLGITGSWEDVTYALNDSDDWHPGVVPAGEIAAEIALRRQLYRGGAADVDAGFADFRADLESCGLWGSGILAFTSDHGEAFWEHGVIQHGSGVYEEIARVPLIIRGPGLSPRRVAYAASLTDIPRTFAAIAGADAWPSWQGTNLLTLEEERPVFTFQCSNVGGPSDLALVLNGRKLITLSTQDAIREGDIEMAFDLRKDPDELTDLADSGAEWPRQLLENLSRSALPLYEESLGAEHTQLSPEQESHLRALGYLGD